MTCTVCEGRIHHKGCTSRPNKHKDCCPARHQMLFDAGHTVGIIDKSVSMAFNLLEAKWPSVARS